MVNELAFRQSGVFASWQLDDAGIPRPARQRRLESGAWRYVLRGVYGLSAVPPSYQQDLWAAWLAVGPHAVVSHESAAELHRIPNVVRRRLVFTVPHSGWHRIPGVFVHQLSDMWPDHRTVINGLAVTTVPRTIVDLATVVHPARLRHVVEDAKHAGLVSFEAVRLCLASVARWGKPGVQPLSRVLDRLGPGTTPTTSRLERMMLDLLRGSDLPVPVAQYPFPGRQFVAGCVDFAYPAATLILETDGRRWHSRIKDLTRDRERDLEAARHGWQTLRFLYEHIRSDPDGTVDTIRTVLNDRLALLAS